MSDVERIARGLPKVHADILVRMIVTCDVPSFFSGPKASGAWTSTGAKVPLTALFSLSRRGLVDQRKADASVGVFDYILTDLGRAVALAASQPQGGE